MSSQLGSAPNVPPLKPAETPSSPQLLSLSWLKEQAVLGPAAFYIYVSIVWIVYNLVYFQIGYSTDIILYYDTKDYLLAGLHHSVLLILTLSYLTPLLSASFRFKG